MTRKKSRRLFIISLLTVCSTLLLFSSLWLGIAQAPNRAKIAYTSYHNGNFEVYVMDDNGKEPVNLTNHPAIDSGPDWSPDGKKIVFESNRNGTSIWVMDANGKNPKQIGFDRIISPVWSPDGKKIAFRRELPNSSSIYVMNADGTHPTNITKAKDGERDESPSWSPDGRKIAFHSNRASPPKQRWKREIFVVDVESGEIAQLTHSDSGYAIWPSWSPSGQKIAYQLDHKGNSEIFVMDSDGKNPINLTNNLAADRRPSWSPDSKKILFDRLFDPEHRRPKIYIMDSDGSNQIRLTKVTKGNDGDTGPARMFDPSVLSVDLSNRLISTWGQIKSRF